MKEKALQRRNSFLLVLAAFIWGIAFVAQSEGGKFGPYAFNGISVFYRVPLVQGPVLLITSKKNPEPQSAISSRAEKSS
ncbi:MAG: hypothetical protein ACLTDV_11955 [Eubacterium sp.]